MLLSDAQASLASHEREIERLRALLPAHDSWRASLAEIDREIEASRNERQQLRAAKEPRRGLLGSLLGLKTTPMAASQRLEALAEQNQDFWSRRQELVNSPLGRIPGELRSQTSKAEAARGWAVRVAAVLDLKQRKEQRLAELKAAAAANAKVTRQLAATVRRRIPAGSICPYCGGPLGSVSHADHIYPVSKGGRSTPRNMVYVCVACNAAKAGRTLAAFIRELRLDREAIEQRLTHLDKDY